METDNVAKLDRKKGILKTAMVVNRTERTKLRALAQSLRQEFQPRNPYEEFIFEKLVVDICRLAKLYQFEQDTILKGKNLASQLDYAAPERFIRYKNSIEKDVKDGYSRLQDLKETRI